MALHLLIFVNRSYKGLDISIGKSKEACGGILIRSIEALDGSKFVCGKLILHCTFVNCWRLKLLGPSLSVDHILELCKADSVSDLVDNHMKGNISVEKGDVDTNDKKKKANDDDEDDEKEAKAVTKYLYLERQKPIKRMTVYR